MDEVNPMAEMGFMHDKQIIIEAQGFLTSCNSIRNLAIQFLKDGGKIYDLLDRYDNVVNYVLNRNDAANTSDSSKLLAPLLKAHGVTDYEVQKYTNKFLANDMFESVHYVEKAARLCRYELLMGANEINNEVARYRAVDAGHIMNVAREVLRPENCTTLHYHRQ